MSKRRIFILICAIIVCITTVIYIIFLKTTDYKVSFDCGKDCKIKEQYIKKNGKVKEPKNPTKDGYVFVEWQLDGKSYDFDSKITNDINLKAVFLPEKYVTINIDYNSYQGTTNFKILSGTSIKYLIDTPTKDGYIFSGWYSNDKEYDLDKKITSNLNLVAHWEMDTSTLSVGDKVRIIGEYADSAYSNNSIYSKAIGWERQIIKIYLESEFPYAVGNEYGEVTGYFKSSSLEKIK